jgi:D-psicose/D-tagatose/L-ribulose 3-epimerase
MLLWTAHVQPEHWPVLEDLKRTGYDGVEIPIFEGEPAHYEKLGRRLRQLGLDSTGIALFPSVDMNPIGETPEQRAAALKHIEWVFECTEAMGAKLVGGPLHSTLGHFSGAAPTEEERRRGVAFHQAAGEMARARAASPSPSRRSIDSRSIF